MKKSEVSAKLKDFIETQIMHDPNEDLDESIPLLEWGILDSLAMVSVVAFIEREFGVKVPQEMVVPENFDNLRHLSAMVVALAESEASHKKAA